jgi:arylsulfatase A-like enzyme
MQTGLYPTTTGCYRNGIPLPPDAKTLAHYFHEAGYDTAYIGKWHLASEDPVLAAQRGGYDYWLASNTLEFTSDPYDTVVYNNDGHPVKLPGYRVDALADAAVRYINEHQQRPFFLFLSFLEPHHQNSLDDYPPPDGYRTRYTGGWMPPDLAALDGSTAHQHLGGYYGMVKRLDEAFGRLLDALKSLNLLANTVVLFTSDHGCHFKTRNSEYKRSCHESSVRVPTAFQGPGFDGGGRVQELVSLIDLPPTLLDAAGIPVPEGMQGRSIMPLLRPEKVDWPEELFIQISEAEVGRAVRTRRWKYGVIAPHKDGWHDSVSDRYVEAYLYDLQADPYELTNLIGMKSHQEATAVLRKRLLHRLVEAGEAIPTIELAPARDGFERKVKFNEANE